MTLKTVTARAHVPRRSRSAGLSIAQLHTEHLPDHLDPFLAFDHFQMAEPFFPPHPHAGFSAVTYMFPQSKNGFINRDSRGDISQIHPGDLHWTSAASGIMHEEVPMQRGIVCHGLQIFVNLHSSKKWLAPEVLHLAAQQIPRVTSAKSEVRIVAGRHGAHASPLSLPTEVTLLDVTLEEGGLFEHAAPADERRFLYVIDGAVEVGTGADAVQLSQGDAVGFSLDGEQIHARAIGGAAHLVVGGGRPLNEPTVFYGPFCMNTQAEITRALDDYQSGKMGRLAASF